MKGADEKKKKGEEKILRDRKTVRYACALAANVSTALLKFVAGAATMSVTVVVSGFYTLCMTAAKASCMFRGEERKSTACFSAALFLALAALFYGAGAVKSFVVPSTFAFGIIPAIAVATAAFYETISAVAGTIMAAKAKDGIRLTYKRIHLSAAVAALALTQTALLAVNSDTQNAIANASMGVIAAAVTAICATDAFARGRKEKKKEKEKARTGQGDPFENKDETGLVLCEKTDKDRRKA